MYLFERPSHDEHDSDNSWPPQPVLDFKLPGVTKERERGGRERGGGEERGEEGDEEREREREREGRGERERRGERRRRNSLSFLELIEETVAYERSYFL